MIYTNSIWRRVFVKNSTVIDVQMCNDNSSLDEESTQIVVDTIYQ